MPSEPNDTKLNPILAGLLIAIFTSLVASIGWKLTHSYWSLVVILPLTLAFYNWIERKVL